MEPQTTQDNQTPATPATAPGSIPTAAQVEAEGAKDAAANPDLKQTPAAAAQPNGVNANNPNLQPKYNVNLIGQRNVGAGLDFYSLDREIALGRSFRRKWKAAPASSLIR